ncbi:hypothetical protein ASAC_0005 [Acidilobus saccharovorans 345-15]|uniref:CRISPR-associated endoribonuclease Cas2 n=1 Tax=Acidilobus saccharovorans (strain DSM 16705 / JCM 18335 / VKM B-2471 / 345-15) TaxID=666510 RepID=D9PZC6_ACIS3|nr:CRISPR-associated endonuclease Cas2 [Acidilobus saccharovorans]ADL18414.1 hypothetical protein ASAC_0005 [Acidilobus saccharovorans 345-15]
MRVLVVYDVSDDSRRLRLSRELERMGLSRVQRSAFVGPGGLAVAKEAARAAAQLVDDSTDVVHVVLLSEVEWANALVVGRPLAAPRVAEVTLLG